MSDTKTVKRSPYKERRKIREAAQKEINRLYDVASMLSDLEAEVLNRAIKLRLDFFREYGPPPPTTYDVPSLSGICTQIQQLILKWSADKESLQTVHCGKCGGVATIEHMGSCCDNLNGYRFRCPECYLSFNTVGFSTKDAIVSWGRFSTKQEGNILGTIW